jgi:cardiolipin synthase A/B
VKFRRALLLADLLADVHPALAALQRVAPELAHLSVVATLPSTRIWSFFGTDSEPEEDSLRALDRLRRQARAVAANHRVELVAELGAAPLIQLALDASIDLLVIGSRTLRDASVLAEVHKQLLLPILWPAHEDRPVQAIKRVLCVALGRAGRASLTAFLRDHTDPSLHVTLLSPTPPTPEELASIVAISGIRATVELPRGGIAPLRRLLADESAHPDLDLLVLTRFPTTWMLGINWPTPVLLLAPPPSVAASRPRTLDVADVAPGAAGSLRVRVRYEAVVGSPAPVVSQRVAFVAGGEVVATAVPDANGEVTLPAGLDATSLGVLRVAETTPSDVLAAIERRIHVIRPGEQALIVFDCELPDESLKTLRSRAAEATPLAVRLRPTRNIRSIRSRLRSLQIPTHVVDASAVLDEGPALDVSEAVDPVRLVRVASRLRRGGFEIAGILHGGLAEPQAPLEATAEAIGGSRIEIELDNRRARQWLLAAIANSEREVHLQVYMAADDEVGRAVETALAAAGARGVTVRVLIDSLHGLHGSFGTENPLLARLSNRAGVELRIGNPVNELPSLADLKRRDHRKLVVVDGALALLGGRNLSHEYYTSFEEAAIGATSPWRSVPWLDSGARVTGAAVTAIAASFREAWLRSGGEQFEIAPAPPVGASSLRVVVHRGLCDANTLEAYLELIEDARDHVDVVNGFPLMLEIQHSLLRARARGVRVRVLTGHPAPTHGGVPFPGPWSLARTAATELVHSRLDPLVEAGAEVYSFARRAVPGWEPGLGVVHPHVHAKVMSVDGRRCSVGSANFDITAAYWESEIIVVVEDRAISRSLEAQLDALIAASTRWTRDDPTWQKAANRRTWMRHWPGVLSV